MTPEPVELARDIAGQTARANGPPVVILHGLFGSRRNWGNVVKRLADRREVVTFDLRNHGHSPHHDDMDFPTMAGDVLAAADDLGYDRFTVVGHSLGGKVAMALAMRAPERLDRLVVVDVAPVRYTDRYSTLIETLRDTPSDPSLGRTEIDRALEAAIPDRQIRQFLLQNYVRTDDGWRWRLGLDGISANLPALMDYPEFAPVPLGDRATLIAGGPRGLVRTDEARAAFLAHFPDARIETIAHVGHWPHVEDPQAFQDALEPALGLS